MSRSKGFPEEVKTLALKRARFRCERCGVCPPTDFHHRQPRGMGGVRGRAAEVVNGVANCVPLCRSCHEWVERNRSEARESGWLVSRYVDPREVPVWVRGRWVILEVDGTVSV